jgi:uncharacterized membrane protein
LWKLQRDYLLELDDAVVVTKDPQSKVRMHQAVNMTAIGALSGRFWGTLIGILFPNPILGTAFGAPSGTISGTITDVASNDACMNARVSKLAPKTSAPFVLVRHATPDKVVA